MHRLESFKQNRNQITERKQTMFKSTENKGFQITFSNGYTISCQFGASNYCHNYGRHLEADYRICEEMSKRIHSCDDCEVAIWNKHRKWITGDVMKAVGIDSFEEEVQANVTADEVAKIIAYVAAM